MTYYGTQMNALNFGVKVQGHGGITCWNRHYTGVSCQGFPVVTEPNEDNTIQQLLTTAVSYVSLIQSVQAFHAIEESILGANALWNIQLNL